MPVSFQTLFDSQPLAGRAQRLDVTHRGTLLPAWLAGTTDADIRARGFDSRAVLSEAELARAEAFRFGAPRDNFILGRLAAKLSLGALLSEANFAALEISNGALGQPLVRHRDAGVSLSHAAERAVAVAFPRELPLAVDFEVIDDARAETARNTLPLSPAEREWLRVTPLEARAACLFLWTAREALGKALGCGLSCPWEMLSLASVEPTSGGRWTARYLHFRQFKCLSWIQQGWILSLALPEACGLSFAEPDGRA